MPSARKYGSIVPRTPLVMTPVTVKPSTSSTSLSLTQMMSSMESTDSHLLAEPFVDFDLSSNCSDALSPIPPFPGGRKRPLIRFASLRSTLLCSPQHILSPGASSELNGCVRTVISTPTPSRLQAILGEVVNVSRWRESALPPYEAGHIPWSTLADVALKPWIFEGSIFPIEEFKTMHASFRHQHNTPAVQKFALEPDQAPDYFNPMAYYPPTTPHSHKALVFEREVTLETNGQAERWSLQVPTYEMNPGMVDMMLELRELNSYFATVPGATNRRKAASQSIQAPPTLVVSSSTLSIAISLDSLPNSASDPQLAVRRGAKPLPTLAPTHDDMSCPNTPTGFLRSPSNYSPKFEYYSGPQEPSMDLTVMMADLRSRCSSLGGTISSAMSVEESRFSMASFSEDLDDEWAFADTLMGVYGDTSIPGDSVTVMDVTSLDADTTIGSASLMKHSTSRSILKNHQSSPRPLAQDFSCSVLTLPPKSPLPSIPIVSSSKQQVRGILKACKSVRFASLPDAGDESDDQISVESLCTPILSPSVALRKICAESQERPARVASTTVSPKKTPTARRASESAVVRPAARRPVPSKNVSNSQGQFAFGRHSIGAKAGKENRVRSSSTPPFADDKSLKGAKDQSIMDSGSKSRMPVAVRNVLARFK